MSRATWLLIHSPLVGAATWSRVADDLYRRGEESVVPDLGPTLSAGGSHAILQAELVAETAKGGPVVRSDTAAQGPCSR